MHAGAGPRHALAIAALQSPVCACSGSYNLLSTCNGILAGLVAITPGCACLAPWAAVLTASIGAAVFLAAERVILGLGVDDPLSASALHACVGAFGVLSIGLVASPDLLLETLGRDSESFSTVGRPVPKGLLLGGGARLLGVQLIGALPKRSVHLRDKLAHRAQPRERARRSLLRGQAETKYRGRWELKLVRSAWHDQGPQHCSNRVAAGLTAVMAWVSIILLLYFGLMRHLDQLRATAAEESKGLDATYGGSAYTRDKSQHMRRRGVVTPAVLDGQLPLGPMHSAMSGLTPQQHIAAGAGLPAAGASSAQPTTGGASALRLQSSLDLFQPSIPPSAAAHMIHLTSAERASAAEAAAVATEAQ